MIGNDVVDLRGDATRAGGRHPRFDERVYGEAELRTLAAERDPEPGRWVLWAAKESAYKLGRRADPALVWSPRRFEVHLDAGLRGRVRWPGGECEVRVERDDERVHALAARSEAELDAARVRVARLGEVPGDPASPGDAVRSLVVGELARQLGADPAALEVRRRGRIPQLFAGGRPLGWPLSLSHHGRFVAFAALPSEPRP